MVDVDGDKRAPVAPLRGVRVLELATMITGPLAGMMLGDLGAEVLKIERPGGGDPFRKYNDTLYSPQFASFNRNKTSRVLDLKLDSDRATFRELVAEYDVLIENLRPGNLESLGLGADALRALNPRLIHCSITGFGAVGPYRLRPAYDTVGQALSGIASLALDENEPALVGTTISDNVTGMYACYGIMAALHERHATGRGRRVEVNMLEASVAFMPDAFMHYEMFGTVAGPLTRIASSNAYVFKCADAKLLAIHLSSNEGNWRELVKVLDAPSLASDPRFNPRRERIRNYKLLRTELTGLFARRPRSEWIDLLVEADVPCSPVKTPPEVMDDPQVEALGAFAPMRLATGRDVRMPRAPVLFDGARPDAWTPPPAYEDTREG